MSHLPSASGRMAVASAVALLSLALLAGCQSDAGTDKSGSSNSDLATVNDRPVAPAERPLPTLSEQLTSIGDRVFFGFDQYDLSPEAQATLNRQAGFLQDFPAAAVTIQGHADERGTREYNLALGERRADSVRNYLIALGVQPERISVVSFGKERPECAEAAEACWAQNRRGVTNVNP
jgi:peptidoglycan-associated lipoprotein